MSKDKYKMYIYIYIDSKWFFNVSIRDIIYNTDQVHHYIYVMVYIYIVDRNH